MRTPCQSGHLANQDTRTSHNYKIPSDHKNTSLVMSYMFTKAYVTVEPLYYGVPLKPKTGVVRYHEFGSLTNLQNAEALTLSQSSRFFRVGIIPMVYLSQVRKSQQVT